MLCPYVSWIPSTGACRRMGHSERVQGLVPAEGLGVSPESPFLSPKTGGPRGVERGKDGSCYAPFALQCSVPHGLDESSPYAALVRASHLTGCAEGRSSVTGRANPKSERECPPQVNSIPRWESQARLYSHRHRACRATVLDVKNMVQRSGYLHSAMECDV